MTDEAHIIEIDSIVLIGIDQRNHRHLNVLADTVDLRVLEGTGLRASTSLRMRGESYRRCGADRGALHTGRVRWCLGKGKR
jgi:hypothetical protein